METTSTFNKSKLYDAIGVLLYFAAAAVKVWFQCLHSCVTGNKTRKEARLVSQAWTPNPEKEDIKE